MIRFLVRAALQTRKLYVSVKHILIWLYYCSRKPQCSHRQMPDYHSLFTEGVRNLYPVFSNPFEVLCQVLQPAGELKLLIINQLHILCVIAASLYGSISWHTSMPCKMRSSNTLAIGSVSLNMFDLLYLKYLFCQIEIIVAFNHWGANCPFGV